MKNKGKFSILLIHDDGEAYRYRISRAMLRGILLTGFLLVLLGCFGTWVGLENWTKSRDMAQSERRLQQELAELKVEVERLSNIEELITRSKSNKADMAMGLIGQAISESVPPGQAPGQNIVATPGNGTPAQPDEPNAASSPVPAAGDTPPLPAELAPLESKMTRIDNVSTRLSGNTRLRISIDLHNTSGSQLAGKTLFALVDEQNIRTPLEHDDQSFRISHYKKVVANVNIPPSISDASKTRLLVEVLHSDGNVLLRKLFPVQP